jgi:hypothetical protein
MNTAYIQESLDFYKDYVAQLRIAALKNAVNGIIEYEIDTGQTRQETRRESLSAIQKQIKAAEAEIQKLDNILNPKTTIGIPCMY